MCWTDDPRRPRLGDYAQQPLNQPSGSGTGVGPDRRLSVGQEMLVPAPLLQTKLFVPRSRRGLVPRPRLTERLDRGVTSTLMIVSAPAGFGKTTLLAEWLAAGSASPNSERVAVWLSLDPGDNNLDPLDLCGGGVAEGGTGVSGRTCSRSYMSLNRRRSSRS
jgi:hypothetical protein